MKKNGIVRRVDELGRLVVPKEIRKSLRIKEGDSVEIFNENDSIVIRRYSSLERLKEFADLLVNSVYSDIKKNIFVTDTNKVISVAGPLKKEFINKNISDFLVESLSSRKTILEKYEKSINFINKDIVTSYIIVTIISNGDVKGSVVMFDENKSVNEFDYQMVKIASNFLSKAIED